MNEDIRDVAVATAPGCDAPLPKAKVAIHCSLPKGHKTPHRAELDRVNGEAFVQWSLDWSGPEDAT